jgi:UDP-N-acetylglucosamine 3-dehydrogenase
MMKRIRVGMMSFAHMHAGSYASCLEKMPQVELVGVADEDEARGGAAAEAHNTDYYSSYDNLLKQDLDGVVICSENYRHLEMTEMAAVGGVDILCEKPISTNAADARKMIALCREAKVRLQIAFPCRFSPAVIHVRDIVREGRLGEIVAVKATNRGRMPGGWFVDSRLSGGGAIIDHTVHVADLLRWYTGAEAIEVYAEAGTMFNDIEAEDAGLLTISYDNGIFATLDTSWSRPKSFPTWGDVYMEFIGTEGVAGVDAFIQRLDHYSDENMSYGWAGWGSNTDMGLIRDWVDCLGSDREPSITGEDGLRALEVALAAYRSIAGGKPERV